jgi:hypothetical protein
VAASLVRPVLYVIASALAVFGIVVAYLWWSTRIERFPGLSERVNTYYALEMKKSWEETYLYRIPIFRQSVTRQSYIDLMHRDSEGWELKSFRPDYVVREGGRVRVNILFTEKAPKGRFVPGHGPADEQIVVEIYEATVWEKINGAWYAWATGSRGHFSLNESLVAPN